MPDLYVEYGNVTILESSPVIYNSDIMFMIQTLLRCVPDGAKATIRASQRVIDMIKDQSRVDLHVVDYRGGRMYFGVHEIVAI